MIMTSSFDEFLNEQLKDPKFRDEYEALQPDYAIVQALIDARRFKGLTKKDISERAGISSRDISRMENANANPSLNTLKRLAAAMDMNLKIEFVAKE